MVLPEVEFKRESLHSIFNPALLHVDYPNSSSRTIVRFCKYPFKFALHGRLLHGDLQIYLAMNAPEQTEL